MKYILLILCFCLFELTSSAQKPIIEWQKTFGGTLFDKSKSIIETKDGGYLISGHSESSNFDLTLNQGEFDFWIIKTDNLGQLQWQKTFGGSGSEFSNQIIQTIDNGYLCIGNSNSQNGDISNPHGENDYWVLKLNNAGTIEWKNTYGGTYNDLGISACQTSDGAYMLAGYTNSNDQNVSNNHGNVDFWIVKINGNGDILWQKTYGGSSIDFATTIIKTADNGFAIIGYSSSTDGDFLFNKGGQDIWIIKIDNIGTIQWKNNFGGTDDDIPRSVIEDIDGNFVIVGETYSNDFDAIGNHGANSTRDYIVIKTNNLGQKLWSKCYGGSSEEYARTVVQTFDGEYATAGESYSTNGDPTGNNGSAEYWIIKIDPSNGNLRWEKTLGGAGHDEATAMVATYDNGFILTGNSTSLLSGDVTINYGIDDVWIVKLKNTECQKKINLTQDIPLGNIEFYALENITSQSKILNNTSNILYSTGKSVILNPGFKTESGAIFEAKIAGCN